MRRGSRRVVATALDHRAVGDKLGHVRCAKVDGEAAGGQYIMHLPPNNPIIKQSANHTIEIAASGRSVSSPSRSQSATTDSPS